MEPEFPEVGLKPLESGLFYQEDTEIEEEEEEETYEEDGSTSDYSSGICSLLAMQSIRTTLSVVRLTTCVSPTT
jgi:hypothetical protein